MAFWGFGGGSIGLIAGSGDYPVVLAQALAAQKKKIVLIGVEGLTDKNAENYVSETHYLGLGDLEKLLKILTDKKIKQVILAGGIPKKEIHNPSFKTDSQASDFMKGIRNKGDDHLIRAFGMYLKVRCGTSIIDPRRLLKDVLAPKGVLTRRQPSESEKADIKFGFRISKEIGRMDIGQTVVVRSGIVLAVEAIEGTNQALRRGAELGCGEVVAVKTSKPKQDLRVDLPCVGVETVRVMAESGVRVLAVEAGKTLMLGKEAVLRAADEKNLTLMGI